MTVAEACASYTCSTSLVGGLSRQIIREMLALDPGCLVRVQSPQIHADSHVHLFLQPVPRDSLMHVLLEREATLIVNSCLRVLPEQMMLWRQYQDRRCGIKLAARPGNHAPHCEGIAVDVHAAEAWLDAFSKHNWLWLGPQGDTPHFQRADASNRGDVAALGIRAFQSLHNQHSSSHLAVDGSYGPETERALLSSPASGW